MSLRLEELGLQYVTITILTSDKLFKIFSKFYFLLISLETLEVVALNNPLWVGFLTQRSFQA